MGAAVDTAQWGEVARLDKEAAEDSEALADLFIAVLVDSGLVEPLVPVWVYIRRRPKMLTHARIFRLTIAALLVLPLVPGASTTAAPSRTQISRTKMDYFDGCGNDLLNLTRPLFSAADAENVESVGHIGGVTDAVAVQGDYAYIDEGPALTVLGISNPASPTIVGKTDPLPDIVQDIAVAGDYAYIVGDIGYPAFNGWLRVVLCHHTWTPT